MSEKYVFFDFDGVIADSFAAALETAQAHCTHKTEDRYRRMFEGNIFQSNAELAAEKDRDHSACNHDLDWWGTFSSLFDDSTGLFAQMDEIVKQLAAEYRLIIVSSSMHKIITSFLTTHKLAHCFTDIYDADVHQSKSEKIGMAFEKYGFGPAESIMITDSKGDILEAREKGVESIAVTWGFNSKEVLATGEPFRIVELPSEIPSAVGEFFHGKGTAA